MLALAAIPAALRTALLAALGAGVLALGGYAWWQRGAATAARREATLALAAVAERDTALADLHALHQRQVAALERQAAQAEAAAARMAPTRRNVDAAPVTSACAAAPAMRAALDGLRTRQPAGGAGGTAGGAGQPADVPAAAGTAGAGRR